VFDNFSNTELSHQIWLATGGAMLVLLQSILSGTRRVWWRLMLSCVLGAGGASLAGSIFADSKYVYVFCGVAAIMAENVIFGLANASEEFKKNPISVFGQFYRLIVPTFGKAAGDVGQDTTGKPVEAPAAG
jgi:hypothetical protein